MELDINTEIRKEHKLPIQTVNVHCYFPGLAVYLTLCQLATFACLLRIYFKINFNEIFFQVPIRVSNSLDGGSDLGTNSLQKVISRRH